MTTVQDPGCPWCKGAGFLGEDNLMQPWEPATSKSAGLNCPRCNPYGTMNDEQMDRLVTRKPVDL